MLLDIYNRENEIQGEGRNEAVINFLSQAISAYSHLDESSLHEWAKSFVTNHPYYLRDIDAEFTKEEGKKALEFMWERNLHLTQGSQFWGNQINESSESLPSNGSWSPSISILKKKE